MSRPRVSHLAFLTVLVLFFPPQPAISMPSLLSPSPNPPSFAHYLSSHTYPTPSSQDVTLSMTLDPSNGFTYISGRTTSPRSPNNSLPGLIPSNALLDGAVPQSPQFTDPIIAKLHTSTGHLVWAQRLHPSYPTSFSQLTLSPFNSTVYAAGIQQQTPDHHPWILQAFDVESGAPTRPLLQSNTPAIYRLSSLTADRLSVYLCGSVSSPPNSALLTRISTAGATLWRLSPDLPFSSNASCVALALHTPTNRLFAILSPPNPASSSPATLNVLALNAHTGAILWAQSLTSPPGTLLRASDLLAHADALFLSFSVYSGSPALNRLHVAKMSQKHGTLLWNVATCCSDLPLDQHIARFQGFGDAALIRGMAVRDDGYVYHGAYYRRLEEMTEGRFATVIARVGQYGSRDASRDVSEAVEKFQVIPAEPKQAWMGTGRGSGVEERVYLVCNKMTVDEDSIGDMVTTVDVIYADKRTPREWQQMGAGTVYVNVTFEIQVQGVAIAAVLDTLAEQLQIDSSQLSAQDGGSDVWQVWVWGFGNTTTAVHELIQARVWSLLYKQGSSTNKLETYFAILGGSVTLVAGTWKTVGQGITAELTGGGVDPGSLGATVQDDVQGQGGGVWGVTILICGLVAGLALTVMVVVGWGWWAGMVGVERDAEVMVGELFDGRPTNEGVEVVYEARRVSSGAVVSVRSGGEDVP